jgi:glutamate---cysteine ligase / carboxylate-amine ligase
VFRQAEAVIGATIPDVNFGLEADFSLGVEEELLLVDPSTYALDHGAEDLLSRLSIPEREGAAAPEAYAALVELASPICSNAPEAAACCAVLRRRLRSAGATMIGAGLHPTGAFGDTVQFPADRYRLLMGEMRGLLARTPTCALHVHVGMPDAETAIRAYNALRTHLPLLQALSANSPFWHGRDSGLASARAQLFRAFPRSEIPPAFSSFDEYAETVGELTSAGELPDYTFLWWDVRPHPMLGTVEVRALDSQSSLASVVGIVALVHSLARWAADQHGPWEPREVLMESSFRAARDGLDATLWHNGAMRPVAEIARSTLDLARPYGREIGSDPGLEEIERLLADGDGAARQRAAFAGGGMIGVLAQLARETAV